jgi:hypothetical protein
VSGKGGFFVPVGSIAAARPADSSSKTNEQTNEQNNNTTKRQRSHFALCLVCRHVKTAPVIFEVLLLILLLRVPTGMILLRPMVCSNKQQLATQERQQYETRTGTESDFEAHARGVACRHTTAVFLSRLVVFTLGTRWFAKAGSGQNNTRKEHKL